ncbi:MAG TPA: branched-chain amino acid ABC transporter substrate-binding protein [Solirubrobacteraceae bacterium]|nr:branched-chain amino acid ABC transporter substrate-binding protein [Solirubrobacteraceae bacterium]
MRARWLCLAALAAGATATAGCGGTGASGASETAGSQLAVYSSLPLQGPSAAISLQIVNGEKLALAQAGGRVGAFRVSYVSLDDSNPASGKWSPDVTATDAKIAAQDTSTIAYLGEYNSAATALSLPLINAAGILQVSPSSPYIGLTSSLDAGQDEPGRFYPSGRRTFARLQPGDPGQAVAQVRLMSSLGVHKVYVLDDQEPFEVPLAQLVAGEAKRAGIAVAAHDSLSVSAGASYTGEVEKIVESGAQAVFFAGGAGPGAAVLWKQLHGADPRLLLLGPSTMVSESFTAAVGAAGASTFLTTPVLPMRMYPRSAQRVLGEYRSSFGAAAEPYALYGYAAMSAVLDAIRSAGSRGNERQAVIDRFFATSYPDSVLGPYSIEADGETTLARYGVDRVVNGRPVFFRAMSIR